VAGSQPVSKPLWLLFPERAAQYYAVLWQVTKEGQNKPKEAPKIEPRFIERGCRD